MSIRGTLGKLGQLSRAETKQEMANSAKQSLDKIRDVVIDINDNNANDLLTELQQMSLGVISTGIASIYYKHQKTIETAKSVISMAKTTASLFNFDLSTVDVSSYTPFGTSLQKLWDTVFASGMEGKDPIDTGVDLNGIIKAYVEDAGYITDRYRATRFSKEYCYVTRPVFESDAGGFYRSYAFMVRPNLNYMYMNNGQTILNPSLINFPFYYSLISTDLTLYSELCRDGAAKSNLFTFANNYIKEIPYIKLPESGREGVSNMHGKSTYIPGVPEVYGDIDIPVTFIDNGRGDIAKLMYAWSMYKQLTARETFPMRSDYIKYKGCDFATSIYIVTVDANWEIIGFGVALNCIIGDPPSHFTQHKMDGFSKNELLEEFTISFKASTYYPLNPDYFDDFNRLSGFDPSSLVDTRGSSSTLYVSQRSLSERILGRADRTSVFGNSGGFGGLRSKVNTLSVNLKKVSEAYSNFSELKNTTGITNDNAYKPYQDTFEFLAKCPGVYTATNAAEPNRRIFKFGFSF